MVEKIPDMEEILLQMRGKFLETAKEKLDRLNEILDEFSSGNPIDSALHDEFRREIHSLKGMGGTFQMPLVSKLCHSFEAFLEDYETFTPELINSSHAYIDRVSDLIDSGDASDEAQLPNWLEGLPQKGQSVTEKTSNSKPSVLAVSENPDHLSLIEKAFSESGFHVVSTKSPFEAYEVSFHQKPQVIVSSQQFGMMDGAELLRSIGATKTFSKAKFAMICPDRRKALDENLSGVHLLSEKNVDVDILNFIAIVVTA